MYSKTIVLSAVMALILPGLASPMAVPEGQLEARQSREAIRLWSEKDFNGVWADLSIEAYDKCLALPTSMKDNVSSFKLGVFNCRFYKDDNCQGPNQWFDSDNANLRVGGDWGYTGSQNDEISSARCVEK
ncbi:putative beta gamma crystallin [Diplodia seriata]|uniref:Putative beta gamma crystallin n=1 Tax=Diplodia seriata TaxID=420778 RepID=A0A0G2E835_9PEZI|nr:putative beta gamma crystallin [Diplodia seriata]